MFNKTQALHAQIDTLYGQDADALAPFILEIDRITRARKLRLFISRDFGLLNSFDAADAPPKIGVLDPELSFFPDSNGFWTAVLDESDRVVAFQAERLMLVMPGTLADAMDDLTVFYDDPDERYENGERFTAEGEARTLADQIEGRVAYAGRLYVNNSLRGLGMGQMLSLLGHGLASAWWHPDRIITFVEDKTRANPAAAKFDYPEQAQGLGWHRPSVGSISDAWLYAKTTADVRRQTAAWLAARSVQSLSEAGLLKTTAAAGTAGTNLAARGVLARK